MYTQTFVLSYFRSLKWTKLKLVMMYNILYHNYGQWIKVQIQLNLMSKLTITNDRPVFYDRKRNCPSGISIYIFKL